MAVASQYALPKSDAATSLAEPAGAALERAQKALLATIARGEAPKGGYNYMLGGGRFSDMSKHPNILNSSPYGSSTAAGQYQFLKSTWDEQAKKYGYKDFSEKTQDTAALNYARDVYAQKTGRKLDDDLVSSDPKVLNGIGYALNKTWTSLPGGPQPNSNWGGGKDFATVLNENLNGGGGDTAAVASKPSGEGGVGSDVVASARAADTAAAATAAAPAAPEKQKDYGEIVGDSLQKLAAGMAGSAAASGARASAPVVPTAQMTTPQMTPTIDPKQSEMQRQQLALAMQRLNSGKLF